MWACAGIPDAATDECVKQVYTLVKWLCRVEDGANPCTRLVLHHSTVTLLANSAGGFRNSDFGDSGFGFAAYGVVAVNFLPAAAQIICAT